MKTTRIHCGTILAIQLLCSLHAANAQVNSGSNGSDGAFNPTTNTVINMADHPDGIYHYTSVSISNGVTVTFIPNANNTPVVWLVQSSVVINGIVALDGQGGGNAVGGIGGPGGYRGGNPGPQSSGGGGPGGGPVNNNNSVYGGNASYGGLGGDIYFNTPPGPLYGNNFLIPLLGGSGGGGSSYYSLASGGGGGGAILIAASTVIENNGSISAKGGVAGSGGGGSGGAVRLISATITGSGGINTSGGATGTGGGGKGRIRFEVLPGKAWDFSQGPVEGRRSARVALRA